MAPKDLRGQPSTKFPSTNKQQKKDLKFSDKEKKASVPSVVYGSIGNTEGSEDHDSLHHDHQSSLSSEDVDDDDGNYELTYWHLLQKNSRFRLYLASYVANHMGEWLTYLASLSAIDEIQLARGHEAGSQLSISLLIVIRLIPNILLSPFGGALADRFDRRKSMIVLDIIGAIVAMLFVIGVEWQSIGMLYLATFMQECVAGIYEPNRSSIIPLLTHKEDEMQKATTLTSIAWSFMAAFGSAAGGFFVSVFGIRSCYLIDSATYLLSAFLMSMVSGKYNVAKKSNNEEGSIHAKSMISDGISYLMHSFFGPLAFLKGTSSLLCGASDVLNVSFSERGPVDGRAARLGILFASVGTGCILGPLLSDRFADMTKPRVIQRLCLYGLGILSFGFVMNGFLSHFWLVCVFSGIRSVGSSLVWINSSLLLQKFSLPQMLGRVTSIEYSAALLGEATSAVAAGIFQDDIGMTAEQVSAVLGFFGMVLLSLWAYYDYRGGGAAVYEDEDETTSDTSSTGEESTDGSKSNTEFSLLIV